MLWLLFPPASSITAASWDPAKVAPALSMLEKTRCGGLEILFPKDGDYLWKMLLKICPCLLGVGGAAVASRFYCMPFVF